MHFSELRDESTNLNNRFPIVKLVYGVVSSGIIFVILSQVIKQLNLVGCKDTASDRWMVQQGLLDLDQHREGSRFGNRQRGDSR